MLAGVFRTRAWLLLVTGGYLIDAWRGGFGWQQAAACAVAASDVCWRSSLGAASCVTARSKKEMRFQLFLFAVLRESCSGHLDYHVFAGGNQLLALVLTEAYSCLDFACTLD